MKVRDAVAADADGIAEVHVRSWQVAYRGLLPQELLDGLDVDQRARGWQRILAEPGGLRESGGARSNTIVAERGDTILGWASYGDARDPGPPSRGELWGIYAHPDVFSTGVGSALISFAEHALVQAGFTSAYLWVLDGNQRAGAFYQRHGWVEDGEIKTDQREDVTLHERRRTKNFASSAPEADAAQLGT